MRTVEELRLDLTRAVQNSNVDEALRVAEELKHSPARSADVYLINISSVTQTVSTNYGFYWIKGRKEGQEYGVTPIKSHIHQMDIGDEKRVAVPLSAEEIARDVARMANGDIGDGQSFAGIFLSYTSEPSESDVTENRAKYLKQCKEWAVMGDNLWAQRHDFTRIADYMRRAVKELKLEKEWAYEPQEMNECPGCGRKVSPKAAVCSHCFAVLDEKKARQLYPDRFQTKQAPRGRRQRSSSSTEVQASQ